MPIAITEKKTIVAAMADVASKAVSLVVAENSGITVNDMTKLRDDARKAGVYMKVVRNTLAKRAFADTDFSCAEKALVGPVVLAFSLDELGASARLLKDFTKENDKIKVTAIALDGKLYGADQLSMVASLPTFDEAVVKLACTMKAPVSKLVRTMAAPQQKLVRVLMAIKDKKEAA